ncbi:unnamed protein product [Clonostachys solani]|uniref:Uncharacterized protein n=1 Tax=Clonostachys solani TaxID=160281 RepID=A0A9P0EQX0_9HYPO|nr:unnamed protein product [Clonostachys solani]
MAMAKRERSFESGYCSSEDENGLKLYVAAAPQPQSRSSPPSRDSTADERELVRPRERPPRPIKELPQIIVPPPIPAAQDGPPTPPPKSPFLELIHAKRKTIMEKVEGWWDLNLLEKRQTLLKGGGSPLRRKF